MVRLLKKIIRKHSFTYTFEHRNRALVIYTFFAEYKRAFDKDHALKGNKLVLSRIPVQVNQFFVYLDIPVCICTKRQQIKEETLNLYLKVSVG